MPITGGPFEDSNGSTATEDEQVTQLYRYGPGTYELTLPDTVTNISVELAGAGGGGGGAAISQQYVAPEVMAAQVNTFAFRLMFSLGKSTSLRLELAAQAETVNRRSRLENTRASKERMAGPVAILLRLAELLRRRRRNRW